MKSKISHKPLQTPNCLTQVLPTLWKAWAFNILPSPHLGKPALEGAPCKDPTVDEFPGHREWPWRGSLSLPWCPFHPAQVSLLHDTRDQLRGFLLSQNPKLLPLHKPTSGAVPAEGWKEHSRTELGLVPGQCFGPPSSCVENKGWSYRGPKALPQPNYASPILHPT